MAVVLLVTLSGGSGTLAGAMAACVTAPHLFGPFVARRIDTSDDPRHFIAAACGLFALVFMATDSRLRRTAYMTMLVAFGVAALPVVAVYLAPVLGISAASAALLTAVYGIGNLAGSAGVMARPIRLTPDQAMTWYAGFLGLALVLVAASGSFQFALTTYFVAGCIDAYFFAATLAARTEYAPAQGKGQVYLWVGALKIAAGSAGTAVAGMVVTGSASLALWIAIAAVVIAPVVSRVDQRAP
ncbi:MULTISPECIES: hypothetical protein [Stenotrophomonas]|uniref:hypothetical protein n=1 Tax=Stenotrophomonas TaxID=40323 RepID=UPI0015DDE691|nr:MULTISPECIES: hypothetical protein [Stenotrophomonas]MBA0448381.1 hypothetical protein [Stenotrophomonas maltophilia]MDH0187402.1 hypothetical protein [Stenotrophomonas sp. GD04051]MDH0462725.1 hypothetical protein [Stenotrophomonas sp. GD03993]MDH0874736.1 hypothetical protein [Stenotrophomonas sp. GD03877]MDH2155734.1 hypothetical protein [Stenotrophomonas sp. GD03657]